MKQILISLATNEIKKHFLRRCKEVGLNVKEEDVKESFCAVYRLKDKVCRITTAPYFDKLRDFTLMYPFSFFEWYIQFEGLKEYVNPEAMGQDEIVEKNDLDAQGFADAVNRCSKCTNKGNKSICSGCTPANTWLYFNEIVTSTKDCMTCLRKDDDHRIICNKCGPHNNYKHHQPIPEKVENPFENCTMCIFDKGKLYNDQFCFNCGPANSFKLFETEEGLDYKEYIDLVNAPTGGEQPKEPSTELNLCELLKDSIGETFYMPHYGEVTLELVHQHCPQPYVYFLTDKANNCKSSVKPDGCAQFGNSSEICVFPSEENRDWSTYVPPKPKWIPEVGERIWFKRQKGGIWYAGTYLHPTEKPVSLTHPYGCVLQNAGENFAVEIAPFEPIPW